jgi:hypothetical protein
MQGRTEIYLAISIAPALKGVGQISDGAVGFAD